MKFCTFCLSVSKQALMISLPYQSVRYDLAYGLGIHFAEEVKYTVA